MDCLNLRSALLPSLQAAIRNATTDMLDIGSVTMVKGSFVDRFHAWETDLLVKVSYRNKLLAHHNCPPMRVASTLLIQRIGR